MYGLVKGSVGSEATGKRHLCCASQPMCMFAFGHADAKVSPLVRVCVCLCVCADFEEQLYDTKLTGQTFRHPSSQGSDDTSLSRSPISLNNKRPDFIFLVRTHALPSRHTIQPVIIFPLHSGIPTFTFVRIHKLRISQFHAAFCCSATVKIH